MTTAEMIEERDRLTDELFRVGHYEPHIVAERHDDLVDRMEDYIFAKEEEEGEAPKRLVVDVTAVDDSEYGLQWTPEAFGFAGFTVDLVEYHQRPPDDGRRIAVYRVEGE